jgi:hypothetical protein
MWYCPWRQLPRRSSLLCYSLLTEHTSFVSSGGAKGKNVVKLQN